MRKIILIGMLYFPCMAFSQSTQQQDSDRTVNKPRLVENKNPVFLYFGEGYTSWEKTPANVTVQPAVGYHIGLMKEIHFKKYPSWDVTTGILLSNDAVSSNAWLNTDAEGKNILTIIPAGTNYQNNLMSVSSTGIPIIIQYEITAGNIKFFLGAGYIIQYESSLQASYTRGDTSVIVNQTNHNNMALFTQNITARIGCELHIIYISVDGFYGLNSVFKSNNGPYLKPYSIGGSISIKLWNWRLK